MLLMVKVVGQGHVIVTFQKFFCREANPKDTKFTSWSILEDGLNFADMQRDSVTRFVTPIFSLKSLITNSRRYHSKIFGLDG